MTENTYQVLEYYRLLDIVSGHASCPLGQSDCLSLRPSTDVSFIQNELKLISELRLLLKVRGLVTFPGLRDISAIVEKSGTDGACLDAAELLDVLFLLEAGREAREFIRANRSLCPGLFELFGDFPQEAALADALRRTVSPNAAIRDSASSGLRKIRERKIRIRSEIQKKLEHIRRSAGGNEEGTENLVTIRDGRYVIALRNDRRSGIKGIIHDYSRTRSTCFMEPIAVVGDNNRLTELEHEERAEERRILVRLTDRVRERSGVLAGIHASVGRLDGLCARARFCEALSCVAPELSGGEEVLLVSARNPILAARAEAEPEGAGPPVPVDIRLTGRQNGLILSGPNRGGKTVTLKTLGLICLMAQAGMHIPAAEGSRISVFRRIMADIGDDQDLQAGLSTFSAHAAHMRDLLHEADRGSLVIIDEPGMGTDPDEGAALAMAVLEVLCEKGVLVAVSTHLNRLKSFAMLNPRLVNAAVEFDEGTRSPTFRLNYGSPGISHGLEIARHMGIPDGVLDRAERFLDQGEVRLNRIIDKLDHLITRTRLEKEASERAGQRYRAAEKELKARLSRLEAENNALLLEKKAEAEAVIHAARQELKEAINLLKGNRSSQASVSRRHREICHNLVARFDPPEDETLPGRTPHIGEGETVYHRKLRQKGVVRSVDPSGERAVIMVGHVRMSAAVRDLDVVEDSGSPGPGGRRGSVTWNLAAAGSPDLDVIGYRVADAIPLIDRRIDQALVSGQVSLKIIHGHGTGILKKAIREHLKENPVVKEFYSEDPRAGGDAVTVVELS